MDRLLLLLLGILRSACPHNGDIAVAGRFLAVGQIHHEECEWRSTSLFDARGHMTEGGLDGEARIASVDDSLVIIGMWGQIAVINAKAGKVTPATRRTL